MKRIRHLLLFLSAASLVFMQGCALTAKTAAVEEIAAETGEMIAEIEYGMRFDDVVLLVRYVDDERIPSVVEWQESWLDLITALRGIARYSFILIEIAGNPEAEGFQQQLADNLSELYVDLRSLSSLKTSLESVELDSILANVRAQEEFLDAAQATAPAISSAVGALKKLATKSAHALDAAIIDMTARIDAYHADVIRYQDTMAKRRGETIKQLQLLDLARTGDAGAWNELRTSDMQMQSELKGLSKPEQAGIDLAERVLIGKLATLDTIRESLQPDFDLYLAELLELRSVSTSIDEAMVIGNLAIGAWAHGHQSFVAGQKTGFALFTAAIMKYAVTKSASTVLTRRY